MPIYDYGYKTWEGQRRGVLLRWLAIPKFTLMDFFSRRAFISIFIAAWIQFLLRLAYIYFLVNTDVLKAMGIPIGVMPPITPGFFKDLIDLQLTFCFVLAFMIGSGLISRDLEHNALVIFFSKPIRRLEYFFGKFILLAGIFMMLTWAQAILLYLIQIAVSPADSAWRTKFWTDYDWIGGSITLYSLILCVTLALLVLTASSLAKRARNAGLIMAIYIIGSNVVAGILSEVAESTQWWAVSLFKVGRDIGLSLFGLSSPEMMSKTLAWGVLIAHGVVCAIILKWRLDRAARYGR